MNKFILLVVLFMTTITFGRDIVLSDKNTVLLNQEVDQKSTSKVISDVYKLITEKNTKEIFLILDTPGGSIEAGLAMIDALNAITNVKIHTITQFAASMGFITVQLLNGERYITPHGVLMSHLAAGPGFGGTFPNGTMDSLYQFYHRRLELVDLDVVKRTDGKHTLESYRTLINHDYWGTGADNLKHGFVDSVANVICGDSLFDNTISTLTGFILGRPVEVKVKRSKCPLITGVEMVDAKVDNKKYKFTDILFNEKMIEFVKGTVGKHQQVR